MMTTRNMTTKNMMTTKKTMITKKTCVQKKCIKVPEVIGRNSTQVLIESVICFPEHFPAVEIKDIIKKVKNLSVHVCKNKVLINGVLHKNINYKTFEGEIKCGKLESFFEM